MTAGSDERSEDAVPGLCAACGFTNHDFRRVCRNCDAPLPETEYNRPRASSASPEPGSAGDAPKDVVSDDAVFYYRAWLESGDKNKELADRIEADARGLTRCREALARIFAAFTHPDPWHLVAVVQRERATLSGATPPQEDALRASSPGARQADADALRDALDFAAAAIGDAIYLEDGPDGEAGERLLQLLAEVKLRGTFDKTLVPLAEARAAFDLTTKAALHVVARFLPPLERVEYGEDATLWIRHGVAEVATAVREALESTRLRPASAGTEVVSTDAIHNTNATGGRGEGAHG